MPPQNRDNSKKVVQEDALEQSRREWVKNRIAQVHRNVSAFDVLQRRGVTLISTSGRAEQFSCPFHGVDRKPSARIYPESARSPSHAWCFVCQERWDVIALWRKFNGDADDIPFTRTLTQIEQAYGLPKLEMPKDLWGDKAGDDAAHLLIAFDNLYEVCENRLRLARSAYQKLDDMVGYLSASSVLDKIRHRVDQRKVSPEKAQVMLRQLLTKIGEKVQACPDE